MEKHVTFDACSGEISPFVSQSLLEIDKKRYFETVQQWHFPIIAWCMKIEKQGVVSENESWHLDMHQLCYYELSKVRAVFANKQCFSNLNYLLENWERSKKCQDDY